MNLIQNPSTLYPLLLRPTSKGGADFLGFRFGTEGLGFRV